MADSTELQQAILPSIKECFVSKDAECANLNLTLDTGKLPKGAANLLTGEFRELLEAVGNVLSSINPTLTHADLRTVSTDKFNVIIKLAFPPQNLQDVEALAEEIQDKIKEKNASYSAGIDDARKKFVARFGEALEQDFHIAKTREANRQTGAEGAALNREIDAAVEKIVTLASKMFSSWWQQKNASPHVNKPEQVENSLMLSAHLGDLGKFCPGGTPSKTNHLLQQAEEFLVSASTQAPKPSQRNIPAPASTKPKKLKPSTQWTKDLLATPVGDGTLQTFLTSAVVKLHNKPGYEIISREMRELLNVLIAAQYPVSIDAEFSPLGKTFRQALQEGQSTLTMLSGLSAFDTEALKRGLGYQEGLDLVEKVAETKAKQPAAKRLAQDLAALTAEYELFMASLPEPKQKG